MEYCLRFICSDGSGITISCKAKDFNESLIPKVGDEILLPNAPISSGVVTKVVKVYKVGNIWDDIIFNIHYEK